MPEVNGEPYENGGTKMKLYTVQSRKAYEELLRTGRLVCDGSKSEFITEWIGFKRAYDWLSDQMSRRIGPPPDGVFYPIWAWPITLGCGSGDLKPDQVKIEFIAQDKDVLLSHFHGWHAVIDDYYLAESFEEYDDFEQMDEDEKMIAKVDSWEKIFGYYPLDECQATIWELRLENVTGFRFSGR